MVILNDDFVLIFAFQLPTLTLLQFCSKPTYAKYISLFIEDHFLSRIMHNRLPQALCISNLLSYFQILPTEIAFLILQYYWDYPQMSVNATKHGRLGSGKRSVSLGFSVSNYVVVRDSEMRMGPFFTIYDPTHRKREAT